MISIDSALVCTYSIDANKKKQTSFESAINPSYKSLESLGMDATHIAILKPHFGKSALLQ